MLLDKDNKIEFDDKFCLICGKKFVSSYGWQKYCSDECSRKAELIRSREYQRQKRIANPKPKPGKICAVCGKKFLPNNNSQKFCSANCRQIFSENKHKITRQGETVKLCLCCGKPFVAKLHTQIFCSKECRKNNRNPCNDDFPKIQKATSNLDKVIEMADACGLSYGQYKAQLAMGKTFEELKTIHDVQKRSDDL